MLDKQDLQAIKELIADSESRTHAEIKASEERTRSEFSAVRAEIGSVRSEIKAAEDRWMTFYESAIQPQLQLLAEGHQTILETLAPKSRVDALEEEVVFLKAVVKNLAQDMAELKKAE